MQIKNFYSLADFYNFIRNPDNAPQPPILATLVPYTKLYNSNRI